MIDHAESRFIANGSHNIHRGNTDVEVVENGLPDIANATVRAVRGVRVFGGAAIPKLARNLGSAKNEFEKGLQEGKDASAPEPKVTGSSS